MGITKKPDTFFYFGWLISGAFSLGLSLLLAALPLSLYTAILGDTIMVRGQMRVTEDYLLGYSFIPMFGLVIGIFQYLLLRRYYSKMGWWVLTTFLGWAPAWLLISVRYNPLGDYDPPSEAVYALLAGMAIGLLLGGLQWLLLRGQVTRAGWWIPVNMLGFGIAGLVMRDLSGFGQALVAVSLPGWLTAIALWVHFQLASDHHLVAPISL
jgi:hypothetical protein